MAKIKTLHKAAVISTDLTIKEIKKVEALNPDCLTIKDAEGSVKFSIGTGKTESISKYGIVFANDSKVSILIDAEKVNRDVIENQFGAILLQLSEVEKQVYTYLETVGTDLDDLIEISEDEAGEE